MWYRCWLDKIELGREQSRGWGAVGRQGKLVYRGDIQKVAEGWEGSCCGNIWGKSGPGRGDSQCQDPEAGAVGHVHGTRRRLGQLSWNRQGEEMGD